MTRAIVILSALMALSACSKGNSNSENSTPPKVQTQSQGARSRILKVDPQLLTTGRVVVGQAEERCPDEEVTISGQVVAPARGKAEIGTLMTSRVRSVAVQEGDVVRSGAVLATLDAPDAARIFGDLAAARARRARAEVVLSQEQALQEQRATSARAVSDARSDAESARADEIAATMLLSAYNVNGTTLTVKSPISGIVAASHARLGAQVDAGTILFRIVDTSKLNIRADVPESLADAIRLGEKARLRFATKRRTCISEVVASTRSVDPVKRTVSFRLQPEEPCQGLLEGGFVDVLLALSSDETSLPERDAGGRPKCVSVPRSAIVEIDSVPVTFVQTEVPGQFRLTPVTLVRHSDSMSIIEQGLQNGDRVVVSGALLLKGEFLRNRLE